MSLHAPRCSYPHPISRDRRNRAPVPLGTDFRRQFVAMLRLVEAKAVV